jgi:hypothetical protein
MEFKQSHSEESNRRNVAVVNRRNAITNMYDTLPDYGSIAYWCVIEEAEAVAPLPLEVLVRCARVAVARGDDEGRNRIVEIIFRRTQVANEYWAKSVLRATYLPVDERNALVSDLYADLCECVIRAIMDTNRLFWEENFQHCLSFERKHVQRSFMVREGWWTYHDVKRSTRIPRILVDSLDQPAQLLDGEFYEPTIEDEMAQKDLLAVEHSDLPPLILHLPEKLKAVILLIFWEGRTEMDTAKLLGITDRTVRNRLHNALGLLRRNLATSQGSIET